MLKINQNTVENVSIKDLKETEEVLKLYNNHIEKPEEERMSAVIEDSRGKLTEKEYNERINHAKSFTMEEEVPTPADWAQIRTLYREIGNQKIADAREKHESIAKEYTGMATVVDERFGNVSPRQAVINYESSRKKVETTKKVGVFLSLGLGVGIFLAVVSILHFALWEPLAKISLVLVQLVGGVAGIAGLILGGYLGKIITNKMLKKQKEERDYFEVVASNNHEVITKLQMALQASEENIKRIEAQYGVEILAKSDFSDLVPFNKKEIKKEESISAVEQEEKAPIVVQEPVKEAEDNAKPVEKQTEVTKEENQTEKEVKPAKKPRAKKATKDVKEAENTDESAVQTENEAKKPKKRVKKAD